MRRRGCTSTRSSAPAIARAATAAAENRNRTRRRPLCRCRAASLAARADRSGPPPSAPYRRHICRALSTAVLPVRFGAFMTDDELPQIVRARRTVLLRGFETGTGPRSDDRFASLAPPLEVLPASRSSSGADYLRARAAAIRPDADARRSRRSSKPCPRWSTLSTSAVRAAAFSSRSTTSSAGRMSRDIGACSPAVSASSTAPRRRRLRPMATVRVRP